MLPSTALQWPKFLRPRTKSWCLLRSALLERVLRQVLIRHRDSAVDQVAPAIGKLVINAANKLVPGEVGISVFWSSYRNEITQCIRAELLEEVLDVDNNALGRGELGA